MLRNSMVGHLSQLCVLRVLQCSSTFVRCTQCTPQCTPQKGATKRCNKNIINYLIIISGDSLSFHNNSQFSTKDADHDARSGSCSRGCHGAWWYNNCYMSNLNGEYHPKTNKRGVNGIRWNTWTSESLKASSMKMRPAGFTSGEDVMPPINPGR